MFEQRWSQILSYGLVAGLSLGNTGCGFLLQSVLGWSDEETQSFEEKRRVEVSSIPAGASISRKNNNGAVTDLGIAPVQDEAVVVKERVFKEPQSLGLVLGGLLTLGASTGLVVYGVGQAGSDDIGESAGGFGIVYLGAIGLLIGISELIVAPIWEAAGGGEQGTRVAKKSDQYTYTAELNGKKAEKFVYISSVSKLAIPMDGSQARINDAVVSGTAPAPPTVVAPPAPVPPPPPVATAPPPPPVNRQDPSQWVVAVMDVEDVNAGSKKGLTKNLVRNLGDQLRIFIAQTGVRTVDRSSQDRMFKEQLNRIKSDTYKACYDDSCQIELGKALAASHILRSRITRFGSRCVLNAELIDLRAEVTIKAASARGGCEAEGFLTMAEEVSKAVSPS